MTIQLHMNLIKMVINMNEIKPISLENLLIDLENPRYDPRTNQDEAIVTIVNEQGSKLLSLAKDIVDTGGLNPSELPMVMPLDDSNTYVVIEGNRRLTALKLLMSPSLLSRLRLPESIAKKYTALRQDAKGKFSGEINCLIFSSREEAKHWIDLRHTGENGGVGIVPWDGIQTHRFRGQSPAFQAIEFVKNSDYLDAETKKKLPKIAITNIERILGTTDARPYLGIDIKNNELIFKAPEEDVIAHLATLVSDVAHKRIKVRDLDTPEQRVEYAKEVASRPVEKPSFEPGTSSDSGDGKVASPLKRIPHDRKTLIPPRLKLTIPHTRINKIYHELLSLDINKFVNSCSVMLRVFVELSVDDYAKRRGISLDKIIDARTNSKGEQLAAYKVEFKLREKLTAVADYLEKNNICSKDELRAIRTIINNKDHILSVDSLNAYVHNKDFNPLPSDLKATWDNLAIFMQRIWSI
jgi:hypothetical protein